MEKNVKEHVDIPSRKIKRTDRIRDILESPGSLVYVFHNSRGENLSAILQETVKLNTSTSDAKTNYHLIVEEYDGETLTYQEAGRIKNLVKGNDLMESNIILLAQPLTKTRSWNTGKESFKRETCMFSELENTFKIVKLDEVLRCSNEISGVTKSTQNFVQNQDSIFKTEIVGTFKQQQRPDDNQERKVSLGLSDPNQPEVGPSRNEKSSYPSEESTKEDKSLDLGLDLDQAIQRSATLKKSNAPKSKIISKFGFLCEPRQGVDIEGLKPNLVEFAKGIFVTSNTAAISLAVLLKHYIGNKKTTTFLHMAAEPPKVFRRSVQLLRKNDESFSYTEDMEEYFQENKKSKMIFASNFWSVNGMEFDHVIIIVSQSEYFLQHYLPQAISRCTCDLTLILLPKEKENTKEGRGKRFPSFFFKTRNKKPKKIVANMIEELKRASLVKQVVITTCKTCEENYCSSISNEMDDKETFEVHIHSDQYKEHLKNYEELEERQPLDTDAGPYADARYVA